jgi:hypothetical protein
MIESIRMRDVLARQQAQEQAEPAEDGRAFRMQQNAQRHLAEQNDAESWFNEQRVREFLTNVHDCTPVEIQDTLDLLATATHCTKQDFEDGWPIMQALATVRGEV